MKISHIIFTLCAASTPLSHSMQLALKKTSPNNKQLKYIALQSRLSTNSTTPKSQKNSQCDNCCCILKKTSYIKDRIEQSTKQLQLRFSTYRSNFFAEDITTKKLLTANMMASLMHASFAVGACQPGYLLPIVTNGFMTASLKLKNTIPTKPTLHQQDNSQLMTDLMAYVNNTENMDDIKTTIKDLNHIKSEIQVYAGTNGLYNKSLTVRNKSKAILDNKLIEPILPIFNKYNSTNIQECITDIDSKIDSMLIKHEGICLGSAALTILFCACILPEIGCTSPLGISVLANTIILLSTGRTILNNQKILDLDHLRITETLICAYKDQMETTKNTLSKKTSKKKKNTE